MPLQLDALMILPVPILTDSFSRAGSDPSVCSVYKMEILRDAGTKSRPVFRVTTDDGDQVLLNLLQL